MILLSFVLFALPSAGICELPQIASARTTPVAGMMRRNSNILFAASPSPTFAIQAVAARGILSVELYPVQILGG